MEVQTLKCTSCGAPINVPNNSDVVECPYCHNQIKISRDNGIDILNPSNEQIGLGNNKEIIIQFGNQRTNYYPQLIIPIIGITIIIIVISVIASYVSYVLIHSSINSILSRVY